ncbi:ceramidase domain-containing protein [Martelella endophytica]|uniref:ceramidase domain-containing protein n=1 Tax=Martelella endophytica TaxID=1486262 RepID=UPI0005F1DA93|nr:ceramidase domain-containing protein [Martelella endophytica]
MDGFIDIYCERTAAGFWNEPINALTNLAFIFAAMVAWRLAWQRARKSPLELTVIALVAIIGVGSFLFHTLATPLSAAFDVVPIWLFFFAYLLLVFTRISGGRAFDVIGYMVATLLGFVAIVFVVGQLGAGGTLNGSLQYAPALLAMAVATAIALWRHHPVWRYFASATAIFIMSLTFRSLDQAACVATAGIGTHFLWHMLNATVLGILLVGAVRELPPAEAGSELEPGRDRNVI